MRKKIDPVTLEQHLFFISFLVFFDIKLLCTIALGVTVEPFGGSENPTGQKVLGGKGAYI